MKTQIQLGDLVKDTISGFTGIVDCRSEWLNGCERISISPRKLKADGVPVDRQTFDAEQIVVVKRGAVKANTAPTGGPKPEPTRNA